MEKAFVAYNKDKKNPPTQPTDLDSNITRDLALNYLTGEMVYSPELSPEEALCAITSTLSNSYDPSRIVIFNSKSEPNLRLTPSLS